MTKGVFSPRVHRSSYLAATCSSFDTVETRSLVPCLFIYKRVDRLIHRDAFDRSKVSLHARSDTISNGAREKECCDGVVAKWETAEVAVERAGRLGACQIRRKRTGILQPFQSFPRISGFKLGTK